MILVVSRIFSSSAGSCSPGWSASHSRSSRCWCLSSIPRRRSFLRPLFRAAPSRDPRPPVAFRRSPRRRARARSSSAPLTAGLLGDSCPGASASACCTAARARSPSRRAAFACARTRTSIERRRVRRHRRGPRCRPRGRRARRERPRGSHRHARFRAEHRRRPGGGGRRLRDGRAGLRPGRPRAPRRSVARRGARRARGPRRLPARRRARGDAPPAGRGGAGAGRRNPGSRRPPRRPRRRRPGAKRVWWRRQRHPGAPRRAARWRWLRCRPGPLGESTLSAGERSRPAPPAHPDAAISASVTPVTSVLLPRRWLPSAPGPARASA